LNKEQKTLPIIQLKGVQKQFSNTKAVFKSLSFEVPKGEFLILIGPSGCGKSTLLRIIAGLDSPTGGELLVDKTEIGYVFQEAHLIPWRTALENVMLPLELKKIDSEERYLRSKKALKKVGLENDADLFPEQLSGGMKMRVSLARALVTEPELLLLDEPFGALDELTRFKLDEELRTLWSEMQITILFVTHSITEAVFLGERILMMGPGEQGILLDKEIELTAKRTKELRGEHIFAKEVSLLRKEFETLVREKI
jgi:NitT/TauT family transport system ATP-binding protein